LATALEELQVQILRDAFDFHCHQAHGRSYHDPSKAYGDSSKRVAQVLGVILFVYGICVANMNAFDDDGHNDAAQADQGHYATDFLKAL